MYRLVNDFVWDDHSICYLVISEHNANEVVLEILAEELVAN